MKRLWIAILMCVILVTVGCGRKREADVSGAAVEKKPIAKQEPGPVFAGEVTRFEQVGHYRDEQMDGYVFYIKHPNMQDIESFCEQKQGELCRKNKSLKMYFFDDKEKVPDISMAFVLGRESDDYCVADYSYNSQIGLSEMTSHKKIPATP